MTRARPSWLTVALFGAGGFLAGVLLVAILGGAKGIEHTTTERVTVSTPARTVTQQAGTAVPDVVDERLDLAIDRLDAAGFDHDTRGGGVFGVLDESNWEVVAQDPPAGTHLERGDSVRLAIVRA